LDLGDHFKKLKPAMVHKVWGGTKMAALKGLAALEKGEEPLGETWEISVHPDGQSQLAEKNLGEFITQEEMPYLVKLIDTSDNLSVQVHPGDEFAKKHENSLGKTECWIILGAKEGAGIYLGMKPGVTSEEFEKAIRNGEEMNKFLTFYPVKRGDFFFVPAGSIHAIASDVFLAEVQQSSGITYRVWDWNRLDDAGNSRELHIDKAMQVIKFGDNWNNAETFKIQNNIFKPGCTQVIEHPQFNLRQVSLGAGEEIEIETLGLNRAVGILNLEGKISIGEESLAPYQAAVQNLKEKKKIFVQGQEAGSFLLVE
tara:strand:+ start:6965 stop:7900 length:936 start_codon:yes stop_codon:yes gene_type:complete